MLRLLSAFALLGGTAALAYVLTPAAIAFARSVGAMDQPGPRKLHSAPVPRLGGLAIIVSATAGLAVAGWTGWPLPTATLRPFLAALGLGLVPIFLVSVVDDLKPLPALVKLAGHVLGATVAVWWGIGLSSTVHLFGYPIELGWMALPLSVLWIAGVTNAFNIIDGLDGLAVGQALISCGSLAAIFALSSHAEMGLVGAIIAAALVGFMPFNLYPAKVFLGDSGATAIGYAVGCLALSGGLMLSSGFAVLLPVLLVGVPVADTLLSILRRVAGRLLGSRAAGVFGPDRDHIHHRLLAAGVSQRTAVLILSLVSVVLVGVGFSSLILSNRASEILLLAIVWAGIAGIVKLDYQEFAFIRRGSLLKLFDLKLLRLGFAVIVIDLAVVAISVWLAIGLKVNDWGLDASVPVFLAMTVTLALSTLSVFWFFGIYHWVWRLADMNDLRQSGLAVLISGVVAMFFHETLHLHHAPRSLFGIAVLVQLCGVVVVRAAYRMLSDWQSHAAKRGAPTLVYGAGYHGAMLARELFDNPTLGKRVVGFLDDNPLKTGRVLNGVAILGGLDDLPNTIARTAATAVIVSGDSIPPERVDQASRLCRAAGVELLRFDIRLDPVDPSAAIRTSPHES
jgi:UDP-GlcNAc:undecaprenyl-phosphate GlcNAc-1-phosphate transferase